MPADLYLDFDLLCSRFCVGRTGRGAACEPLTAGAGLRQLGWIWRELCEQLQRDAWFWGLSIDYGRILEKEWAVNGALSWDREKKETGVSVETYTFVATVSWIITERFSLTTGLAKGFADNDNKEAKMQFTNADLGTGLAIGISLPELKFWALETVALSVSYEYNISASETDVSLDLTTGISF